MDMGTYHTGMYTMPLEARKLLYSQLISQSIQTFIVLGLPDVMDIEAYDVATLAEKTNTHPAALLRLLRALAQFGVVVSESGGQFTLTPLGQSMTNKVQASVQPTALLINGEMGQSWRGLTETIRSGISGFETQYNATLFDYFEANPERRAIFDRSQDMGLDLEVPELLEYLDIQDGATIVDIGGGSGHLLMHMLEKWPKSQGVLFDLPVATEIAQQRLRELGKMGCYEIVSGDFFKALPENGSVYVLSHVLHDWSDEDCRKILATCRRSMPDNAVLIIIDLIAGDEVHSSQNSVAAIMDLYMLSLFGVSGGRERSEEDFRTLSADAGFVVEKVMCLPSGNGIIYAYP